MTVDVDAVNEKLNGLVNLLQLVGIEGVDPNALVSEQQQSPSTPKTAQSTDSQILEIIKKLQLAQTDSPEILAALQSPELRALASLAAQKQKPAEPTPAPKPSLEEIMDDDDNYPKIGPGYSDDISVVSDLTTPTVMTKQQVAEEEYYKDVNGGGGGPVPPMQIGGSVRPPMSVGGGGKTRNKLGQVSAAKARNAIAKTGGAAAQRRLNYKQAMAKLQTDEYGTPAAALKDRNYMDDFDPKKQPFQPQSPTKNDPSDFPSMSEGKKKSKSKDKRKSKKKSSQDDSVDGISKASKSNDKRKSGGDGIDWGNSGDTGWDAFDNFESAFGSDPFGTSAGKSNVDGDGFFTNDVFANADPFGSNGKSSSTGTKKKKTRTKTRDDGQGTRTRTEKSRKRDGRKQRRASLQM